MKLLKLFVEHIFCQLTVQKQRSKEGIIPLFSFVTEKLLKDKIFCIHVPCLFEQNVGHDFNIYAHIKMFEIRSFISLLYNVRII